jgi:hypothetical protein
MRRRKACRHTSFRGASGAPAAVPIHALPLVHDRASTAVQTTWYLHEEGYSRYTVSISKRGQSYKLPCQVRVSYRRWVIVYNMNRRTREGRMSVRCGLGTCVRDPKAKLRGRKCASTSKKLACGMVTALKAGKQRAAAAAYVDARYDTVDVRTQAGATRPSMATEEHRQLTDRPATAPGSRATNRRRNRNAEPNGAALRAYALVAA